MGEETPVFSGVGSVFTFDADAKTWVPVEGGSAGVFIYHNPANSSYRVIGVAQSTQQFILNSTILAETAAQRNSDEFCSWRDPYAVNGVQFAAKDQADEFMKVIDVARAAAAPESSSSSTTTTSSSIPHSTPASSASPRPAASGVAATATPSVVNADAAAASSSLPNFLENPPSMKAPLPPPGNAPPPPPPVAGGEADSPNASGDRRHKKEKKVKKDKKDKEQRRLEKKQRKEEREKALKEALEAELASAGAETASTASSESTEESRSRSGTTDARPTSATQAGLAAKPPPMLGEAKGVSSSGSQIVGSGATLAPGKSDTFGRASADKFRPMSVAFSAALESSSSERDLMVKEILVSESTYVANLEKLIACADKMLADAKAKEGPLDYDTVRLIFGNVKNIKMLNTKLATNVKTRLANWSPFALFADIFQELLPFFKEYKTYAVGYMAGIKALEAQLKTPKVEKYVREIEKHALDKGRDLTFYMPIPIYRIGRYLLLLNQIFRRTPPDHPDHPILKAVLEKLPEYTNELQEVFRKTDSLKRTLALSKSSEFTKRMQTLMTEQRFVVFDDPNTTSLFGTKDSRVEADHVLLFEEVLVFTSMKQGKDKKKKDLLVSIPLEYLWSVESKKEEAKPTRADFVSIAEGSWCINFESASHRVVFCATLYHYQLRLLQKRSIKSSTNDPFTNRFLNVRGEDGNDAEGYFEKAKLHGTGKMSWKSGASFVGGWADGRMSGQGKFTYKTGETLEGQWKDTAPHGKLLFTCPDGTYEGDWEMGVRHGQGVCKWSNGDTYTGQFEKDLPHGRGVFQAKDGGKYEGDFKFFLRHGKGTLQSLSGIYTGDWVDDRREGQGTQKYINGDEYTGGWKDDMRHGQGTFKSANGTSFYDGEWAENKRNGKGKQVTKDYTYEGEWKNDAKGGHGKLTRADGAEYEGRFKDDAFELQGKLKLPTGESYDGSWHNGKRSGKGVWMGSDGSKYDGEWYKDEKTGKGTLTYRDGSTYSGEWQQDMRQGTGTFTTKDQSISYAGGWVADRRNGSGVQTDKQGKFEGAWKDDRPHGHGVYTLHAGATHEPTFHEGLKHAECKVDGPRGAVTVRYTKGVLQPQQQSLDVIDALFAPPVPRTFLKM